jgi:hypothetical protein
MSQLIKSNYGSGNQAITVTLASLANAARRASTAIDNTTNLFLDALVQLKIKTGASGVLATGYVEVFAYATADPSGPTYAEAATGSDAAITLTVPPNLKLIGILNVVANATSYVSEPLSVAAAFGGVLPAKWGIVIGNQSGAALDSTEGNHAKFYQGVQQQVG